VEASRGAHWHRAIAAVAPLIAWLLAMVVALAIAR
jgi:hypothetical protein